MNDVTVYVVDDDPSFRTALTRLLTAFGFRVHDFGSSVEFLDAPRPAGVACLLLDVEMPGQSGLDLQLELAARSPGLPVVFLTGHGTIPMTVQAMKGGAADFIPKPVDEETLLAAVRDALAQSRRQQEDALEREQRTHRLGLLTPREREVFEGVTRGLMNKQIACDLGISEKTVKIHRRRVMDKLRVDTLADLVRLAPPPDDAFIREAPRPVVW